MNLCRLGVLSVFLLALATALPASAAQPEFVYETVIPGYYLSYGTGMTVDQDGNAYVIGSWYEDHQHLDILVAGLDPDGNVRWQLPIVGDPLEPDYAWDITLGPAGYVWVTGQTSSESFPIVDGFDDTLTGFTDAFIMKLDPADGTILYSTFLGGDYVDYGRSIVLNDAGEIYLVGNTGSTDFPTTEDAYQTEPSAPLYIYSDAFITKISADGSTILYSTYFGGFEDDTAEHVRLDPEGNIIISGETLADDLPLVDPIMTTPDRMFVSKLSADGSTLLFSTYFGGGDYDRLGGMDVDPEGHVYIVGSTRSVDLPTTPGAYQEDFVGDILGCEEGAFPPVPVNCFDVFVTKMGTDGSGLVYSTFLGGSVDDEAGAVAVDAAGSAYVVGYTTSPDYLGSGDLSSSMFVAKLNPEGSDLAFALTKHSNSADLGRGVAFDDAHNVYFTGAVHVPSDVYVAKVTEGGTSFVPGTPEARAGLRIGPSTPNPFTGSTRISYDLPGGGDASVSLAVYDVAGGLVRTLVDGLQAAGPHSVVWDGTSDAGAPSTGGVYFLELRRGGEQRTGRLLLVR